jgi:glycosyltransferase involved in cell wall biosynthesis
MSCSIDWESTPRDGAVEVRVLYVIDSLRRSGAELSLASVAEPLIAQGIELEVAHLHDRAGVGPELVRAGATLHSLAGAGGRAGWVRRCRHLVRDLGPDLVHTTLFEADQVGRIAARSCGVPVVSSLVGIRYGDEHRSNPAVRLSRLRAAQAVDVLSARLVRRFHAVSAAVAEVMGPRLRIAPDKIEVVHRGRDPELLGVRSHERRTRARSRLGVSATQPLVLSVARHEHVKGLDVLIAAAALLRDRTPDVAVLVAGPEAAATPVLRHLIEHDALDGTVRLLGVRDDISDLMCAADVVVVPSRSEGFPNVVVEAMALEAPLVASDLDSVREILGPTDEVRLVRAGQVDDLASALAAVLDHRPETGALRRRYLERFTVSSSARAMVGFYERALSAAR